MIVQTASKSVLNNDHAQAYPVTAPRPLLEDGSTQGRQIVLQMPTGLEDRPEDIGHGEDDADEGYIRKSDPLFPLPKQGPTISAARAAL